MGMAEERWEAAVSAVTRAERMYRETGNAFWVLEAIAASSWVNQTPPKWATDIMMKAAITAWQASEWLGKDLSVDSALGLKTKRGGVPIIKAATKDHAEVNAFDEVKVLLACFDVSIPEACEIVYYAVDYDFARSMEETLWRPYEPRDDDRLTQGGITREQWQAAENSHKNRSNAYIAKAKVTDAVREKMRSFNWWGVTRGDQLGYELDRLIDRYYRVGTKRAYSRKGKADEKTVLYCEGQFLLLIPERCTHRVDFKPPHTPFNNCVSAISGLTQKPEFEAFCQRLSTVGK